MTSIRLSRPKKSSTFRFRLWTLPEKWAGSRLLFLGWFAGLCLLAFLPATWLNSVTAKEEEAWFDLAQSQVDRITQAFCGLGNPKNVVTGDEPEVVRELARNPLTHAVADPDSGKVWVRDGSRLRLMGDGEEAQELATWATRAKASGKMLWTEDLLGRKHPNASFTLVYMGYGPVFIKRWVPGDPAVDAFLEQVMVGFMPIRFGLIRTSTVERKGVTSSFIQGGRLQVANLAGPAPFRKALSQKRAYGDWFTPYVRMPDSVYREKQRVRALRATIAWGAYAMGALLTGGTLFLLVQAQARKQMDSKRLAALAHSLKTPLAMMKMRCDSALNSSLSRERQEAHLMRVGDGVEQLLHLIEHGLEPFRTQGRPRPEPSIPGEFFPEIEAEFRPAFDELGRKLEVRPGGAPIRTSPSSLRSALSILVENALLHGQGKVALTTARGPRGTVVQVGDEGPGIAGDRLALLREPGGETPEPAPTAIGNSQGLGLALLVSLARREGWGLLLDYGVKGGFSVSIEIPR